MRMLNFQIVVILAALLPHTESFSANLTEETSAVVIGNNRFAVDLYRQLAEAEEGNLFFSPFSISTALAMTYAGTRGQTEAEMAETLSFTLPQSHLHAAMGEVIASLTSRGISPLARPDVGHRHELNLANRLWGLEGYPYQQAFLDTTRNHYGAELAEMNFVQDSEGARHSINQWVEAQTHDTIRELIPLGAIDYLTRLVLTNAIYFNSDWLNQFDPHMTRAADFRISADENMQVPMMGHDAQFGYAQAALLQIIEIPYVGNGLSMFVLLPNDDDGLADVEAWIDADELINDLSNLHQTRIQLKLPKFEIEDEIPLNAVLESMGMTSVFDPLSADLSGIANDDLFISSVLHKAFIGINEAGTEAAAATGAVATVTSMPPQIEVDHPFAFLIQDTQTGSILFMGRVVRPDVLPLPSSGADFIDILREAIIAVDPDPYFDINDDQALNAADLNHMIRMIEKTEFGDSDLNKIINFSDFVNLTNNFEGTGTEWQEGNFNLDENTNFSDFVILSNNYGKDLRSGVPARTPAPEPASLLLLSLAIGLAARWQRGIKFPISD